MKIKISWPAGIIIALGSFIIFILSFVYKAIFVPKYDHHLVSEEYYMDAINYQQEIDLLNKTANLKENVTIKKVAAGLMINFPSEFTPTKISGTISFQRLSNKKLDFRLPISLKTHNFLLKNTDLVKGRWDVKIEWTANNDTYLFKEKIMY
ncbi:MAG: cytochrome C oxidase Cbb3 [Lutibacter sp.]|nr:MAG: cytochrome C oxidase Cbb3 [Lutibacter sp.]